jgi:ubiquinone biosynthesis protein UbiJ
VALTAIKGLNQKLEERLAAKQAEVDRLTRRLEALEKRLNELCANPIVRGP